MSATTTVPATGRAHRAKRPMLHAFPDNSLVALCGRTRKEIEDETVTATERCPTCLHEAGRKSFVGR